jgi:TRAP-type C4-dicarboxylate transport system permease small subunit
MPLLLNKTLKLLHLAEDSAIVILVLVMITLSGSSLVLRNLEMSGLTWAETAIRISVLWLAMFGALRASREQSHIAIDLITHYTPKTAQRVIHFFVSISAAIICAIAAWHSYVFVQSEKVDGMLAFLNVPAWACEAIIPFGLAVITLRFVFHSLKLPTPHEYTV